MRLSKKLTLIFICSSLVTVVFYIMSSSVMTKFIHDDEVDSIAKMSVESILSVNSIRSDVINKGKSYTDYLVNYGINDLTEDKSNELLNALNELEVTQNNSDYFEYKFIVSKDCQGVYQTQSSKIDSKFASSHDAIVDKIKNIISNNSAFKLDEINSDNSVCVNGVTGDDNTKYLISINPINHETGKYTMGYLVLVKNVDDEVINNDNSLGRTISIVNSVKKGQKISGYKNINGVQIETIEKDGNVYCYYKIPNLEGEKNYYVEVSQSIAFSEKSKKNLVIFSLALIFINIIISTVILLIIEKIIIKRINDINRGINRINESQNLKDRIPDADGKDEISTLAKDINLMFQSLEDSNIKILSNERKYSKLVEGLDDGYAYFKLLRDKNNNITDAFIVEANPALAKMFNKTKEELFAGSFTKLLKETIKDKDIVAGVLKYVGGAGGEIKRTSVRLGVDKWAYLTVYKIEDDFFVMMLTDISENKKFAEDMKHLANYDVLTNLQNRYSIYNYLEELKEKNEVFNIFFVDLDNFKTINDTLGHNTGDEVLCRAAQILQTIDPKKLTVGRLGGDEFLVIMKDDNDADKVIKTGEEILKNLNTKFNTSNGPYMVEASLGAAMFPKDSNDIESLLKYADIAMYKSKKSGGNKIQVFSKVMFDEVIIESEIKEGLTKDEFIVYYQPIFDLAKNKIIGAEALSRWNKDGEILEAPAFIPVAKKTGDILEIDNMVFSKACEFCKRKRMEGNDDFIVCLNASYAFLNQEKLLDKIKAELAKNNLPPFSIKFEITEDEIVDDISRIAELLKDIKNLGIKISLDDFGVGYSSFSYIKLLPIDTLKIDKELLKKVEGDRKTLAIISALIQLAHTLNLDVVAEGIEIEEQKILLRKLRCDLIQGFLIGAPVPKNDFPR